MLQLKLIDPPMAKWGIPPPTGSSSFSQDWEELLCQTKFLAVVLSLGHLSMKKNFQIGPIVLALKLDKGRVLSGWQPSRSIEQKLTYFSNHEDDMQS